MKPNIANILLFNFCEPKFLQHGPITIAIDCNFHSLLIFEEKWPNYTSGPKHQTLDPPNSDSYWVHRLFNVCVPSLNAPLTKWASSEKTIFFAKIGSFCKSISGPLSEAKTHWMSTPEPTLLGKLIPRSLWKIRLNDVSEVFSCCERRWIDVDGASRTLFATVTIFSRTVFSFSRFVLSMGMRTYGADGASVLLKSVSHTSATFSWFSKLYRNISRRCKRVYTTIFVQQNDKTNYLSYQTWAKYYHSRNKPWLKKMLDGGPNIKMNLRLFVCLNFIDDWTAEPIFLKFLQFLPVYLEGVIGYFLCWYL